MPPSSRERSAPAGAPGETRSPLSRLLIRLAERRDVLSLMALTLLAKPAGFAVQLLIASRYGAQAPTDAYFVSFFLATFLASIGVQVFTTLVVPLYYDHRARGDERATLAFQNAAILVFLAPLVLFSLVLLAAPRLAIAIAAPGFGGATGDLAVRMTRLMAAGALATGAAGYLSVLLNVRRIFWLPGILPLVQSGAMVAAILGLSRRMGPEALAIGFLAGALLQVAVQLPIALRLGLIRFVPPAWGDPVLARLRSLAGPVVVSSLIVQALFMVDKMMGSLLDEGSVSVLGYATTVNMLTLQVFAGTLVTVLFTDLASLISRGDMPGFRDAFRRDTRYLLAMIVPFAALAAVRGGEIISVLFERGRFDETATRMTSRALLMYSLGLPVLGMNMLLGRVFHALKEMKARMVIDFAWLATNVLLNLALIRPLGVSGLALGTSAAAAVNVVLAIVYLRRRHGGVGEGAVARAFLESIAAGAVMAAAIAWIPEGWPVGAGASRLARAGALCVVGTVGMICYALILVVLSQIGRGRRLPASS